MYLHIYAFVYLCIYVLMHVRYLYIEPSFIEERDSMLN